MNVITEATEIAAAAWFAADPAPFVIVPCYNCGGFGTNRVHFSGRLHDHTDVTCTACRGDGEVAAANPAYTGPVAAGTCDECGAAATATDHNGEARCADCIRAAIEEGRGEVESEFDLAT